MTPEPDSIFGRLAEAILKRGGPDSQHAQDLKRKVGFQIEKNDFPGSLLTIADLERLKGLQPAMEKFIKDFAATMKEYGVSKIDIPVEDITSTTTATVLTDKVHIPQERKGGRKRSDLYVEDSKPIILYGIVQRDKNGYVHSDYRDITRSILVPEKYQDQKNRFKASNWIGTVRRLEAEAVITSAQTHGYKNMRDLYEASRIQLGENISSETIMYYNYVFRHYPDMKPKSFAENVLKREIIGKTKNKPGPERRSSVLEINPKDFMNKRGNELPAVEMTLSCVIRNEGKMKQIADAVLDGRSPLDIASRGGWNVVGNEKQMAILSASFSSAFDRRGRRDIEKRVEQSKINVLIQDVIVPNLTQKDPGKRSNWTNAINRSPYEALKCFNALVRPIAGNDEKVSQLVDIMFKDVKYQTSSDCFILPEDK